MGLSVGCGVKLEITSILVKTEEEAAEEWRIFQKLLEQHRDIYPEDEDA